MGRAARIPEFNVFRWLVGRLRCLGGKRERSQRHAHKPEGAERYISRCIYCRVPLERREKRDWIVVKRTR